MASLKEKLIAEIIHSLEQDASLLVNAALVAHDAATHEESKAEDKYDTRGLEASYLAGAQAKRASELQQLIYFYQTLPLPDFNAHDAIAALALIEVESKGRRNLLFMVPKGGGTHHEIDGHTVQVLTPVSKLGAELLGRTAGETFEVELARQLCEYKILSVR